MSWLATKAMQWNYIHWESIMNRTRVALDSCPWYFRNTKLLSCITLKSTLRWSSNDLPGLQISMIRVNTIVCMIWAGIMPFSHVKGLCEAACPSFCVCVCVGGGDFSVTKLYFWIGGSGNYSAHKQWQWNSSYRSSGKIIYHLSHGRLKQVLNSVRCKQCFI